MYTAITRQSTVCALYVVTIKTRPEVDTERGECYNYSTVSASADTALKCYIAPLKSDNVGVILNSFVMLCGNELNVVRIDNCLFKSCSEVGVDGMNDVTVGAVGILSGGHYDEISVACVDYLNVVNGETVVERYGYNRLHRSFIEEFSDFDVCDLHFFFLSSNA